MRVVVIGGSIAGSVAAIGLARSGVDVILLEKDGTDLPADPRGHDLWTRPGAPHVRQAHAFLSLFVRTLADVAPDVLKQLEGSGVIVRGPQDLVPSPFRAMPDPGDEDLVVINSRRSLVEAVLRAAVLCEPGVEVRTGVRVSGLSARMLDGVPHVDGVVTDGKETIHCDVVLAAAGRRTDISPWLAGIGAKPGTTLRESTHTLYFTRHYLLKHNGPLPKLNNGFSSVNALPFFTVLLFPGDNGVVQVAMGGLPEDTPMKGVRHAEAFQAVAEMSPDVGPWVGSDLSEPISDVGAMGSLENWLHRLVVDGRPVLTGFHLIGDSAALTNPQYGRGVSHAAAHAWHVTKAVLAAPDDPRAQSQAVDEEVKRMLLPSYLDSVRLDRSRTRFWRQGAGLHALPESDAATPPFTRTQALRASTQDPVVFRAAMRGSLLLEPPGRWLNDPEVVERIMKIEDEEDPSISQGMPTRDQVLSAISRAS